MKIIASPRLFQKSMEELRRKRKTIGFVPTMGALHEGHASLIRRARRENDIVAVSIFVNPLQFAPKEDLKKYPRPALADRKLLKKEKADYLFSPAPAAMYPEGFDTAIEMGVSPDSSLADGLCGKFRPGHFRGVATVVAKLFQIVKPHRVYFGAKDYQQARVIHRMIQDLNFDISFKLCPTIREKDGLAMSSRNRYLKPDERKRAGEISKALFGLRDDIHSGQRNLEAIKWRAWKHLSAVVDKIQYLEIVDPETLFPLKKYQPKMAVLTACFIGKTRLIDNVIIRKR